MPVIQNSGQTTILNTTATGAGSWYQLHPKIQNLTFQVLQTGTSIGTSVGSTTYIEFSNDGVNAIATKAATVVFGNTTALDRSPASDGFSSDAHYNYVRANLNSLTTGNVSVIVSAQMG